MSPEQKRLIHIFTKFNVDEIEYYNGEYMLDVNGTYVYTYDIKDYLPVVIKTGNIFEFSIKNVHGSIILHIPTFQNKPLYYENVQDWFKANTTFYDFSPD